MRRAIIGTALVLHGLAHWAAAAWAADHLPGLLVISAWLVAVTGFVGAGLAAYGVPGFRDYLRTLTAGAVIGSLVLLGSLSHPAALVGMVLDVVIVAVVLWLASRRYVQSEASHQPRRRQVLRFFGSLALAVAGLSALGFLRVEELLAHCDGEDGPVVKAAQQALATGNANLALVWVRQRDEAEILAAFRQTLAVRKLGPESRRLADRHFFETLVRVHRAGEGAAYTGLKPAGRDLGPAIPAADRAIERGSVAPLEELLATTMRQGLREAYGKLAAKRNYDPDDVAAGREYVAAYVAFIHYVERLHEDAAHPAAGHYDEAAHASDAAPGERR